MRPGHACARAGSGWIGAALLFVVLLGLTLALPGAHALGADGPRSSASPSTSPAATTPPPFSGTEPLPAGAAVEGPVTVVSRVTLPPDPQSAGAAAVVLAGLGEPEALVPRALTLVWAESESSFFPTWSLQLHSDRDLLPSGSRYRVNPSRLLGTRYVALATTRPQWGHAYETWLSYDPANGGLSLLVTDLTSGEEVYREIHVLRAAEGPFAYAGGLLQADGAYAAAAEVHAYPAFLPRAARWGLVDLFAGRPGTTPLLRVGRDTTEGVGVRLDLPLGVTGDFRVYVEAGGARQELVHFAEPDGVSFLPVPLESLPVGPSRLVLEYFDEGRLWFTESRPLAVGRIDAHLSLLSYDREEGRATGTLTLTADGPLPETDVTIVAELARMVWDEAARRYRREPAGSATLYQGPLALAAEPKPIPLSIAPPVAPPAGEPALWEATVLVQNSAGVATTHLENARLFSTYPPPPPDIAQATGEAFTIAAIPDPQYYSHPNNRGGHPDIYVRQMQWLAEAAGAERIGIVLALGDLTDHNATSEWSVSQRSFTLLDGVIPYVLAIGNHDLGPGGNASVRETFFNVYFPVERYEGRPTFGGTFRPGELENSYHYVTLGGTDFLILSLEFLPRDEVLAWANEVAAAHPDHTIIVITHYYTARSGDVSRGYGEYALQNGPRGSVNSGEEVWQKFVRRHPNILMVLSGHIYHDSIPRQVRFGDHGNRVYNMLIDFQGDDDGGNGWLALLRFFPEQERIGVGVYSPYLGRFKEDRSGGYAVPFCIDLRLQRYVPADEACAVTLQE